MVRAVSKATAFCRRRSAFSRLSGVRAHSSYVYIYATETNVQLSLICCV